MLAKDVYDFIIFEHRTEEVFSKSKGKHIKLTEDGPREDLKKWLNKNKRYIVPISITPSNSFLGRLSIEVWYRRVIWPGTAPEENEK